MLFPASGTGVYYAKSAKIIRFVRKGCANRPYFHIVVTERKRKLNMPVIEQLGIFDPLVNQHNEKLVSLNLERICYWIGKGALCTKPMEQLLGISGLLPIHPTSYVDAWRARAQQAGANEQEEPKKVEEQQ